MQKHSGMTKIERNEQYVSVIFHKGSFELRIQQLELVGDNKKKVNNEYAWCAEVAAVHLLSVMNNLRHVLSPQFPRGYSKATLPSPQRNSAGWRTGSLSYSQYSYKKGKRNGGKLCLETDMSPAGMLNLLALPAKAATLTTKV